MTPQILDFFLQMAITLAPVAIILLKQNGRIAKLEQENRRLLAENVSLNARLSTLTEKNAALQAELDDLLRDIAGMRDRF